MIPSSLTGHLATGATSAILAVVAGCSGAPEVSPDAAIRPVPKLLAKKVGAIVSALAVDGSQVYFGGPGFIDRVSSTGGTAEALFATDSDWPCDIAYDANNLYWGSATNAYSLRMGPKSGGIPATLATANYPTSQLVSQGNVYFRDGGGVYRVAADGNAPPQQLAETLGPVGWSDGVGCRTLAMAGTNLFTAHRDVDASVWRVVRVSRNGGQLTPLHEFTYEPGAVLVDATTIYWADTSLRSEAGGGALVWKGAIDGSSREPFVEDVGVPGGVITSIAMDADSVYWTAKNTSFASGIIGRKPKAGGDAEILYDNLITSIGPLGLTIANGQMYWISFDNSTSKVFTAPVR